MLDNEATMFKALKQLNDLTVPNLLLTQFQSRRACAQAPSC